MNTSTEGVPHPKLSALASHTQRMRFRSFLFVLSLMSFAQWLEVSVYLVAAILCIMGASLSANIQQDGPAVWTITPTTQHAGSVVAAMRVHT